MSKQPEALRLADALAPVCEAIQYCGNGAFGVETIGPIRDSAAELRRLHALNGELLEALQVVYESLCVSYPLHSCDMDKRAVILGKARAAIAKATGEQQ